MCLSELFENPYLVMSNEELLIVKKKPKKKKKLFRETAPSGVGALTYIFLFRKG